MIVEFLAEQLNGEPVSTLCLTDVRASHVGRCTSRQVEATRRFYPLRSLFALSVQAFSTMAGMALLVVMGVVEPLIRRVFCLARGDGAGVFHAWTERGLLRHGIGRIVRGQGRFYP